MQCTSGGGIYLGKYTFLLIYTPNFVCYLCKIWKLKEFYKTKKKKVSKRTKLKIKRNKVLALTFQSSPGAPAS